MFRRVLLLVALLLPLAVGLNASGSAQEATPIGDSEVVVLAPDESYAGRTRAEWDMQQWQMMMSFPADINPGFDLTGERCGYGQSGPVFLLPGSFSPEPREITCIVPQGMAIFVPLGGAGCSSVDIEPYFGGTEEELQECAISNNDVVVSVGLTINGQEVPDIMEYRTVSPMIPIMYPENNVFELPPGAANMASDSYSVIIAPLLPGEYQLVTTMEIDGLPEPFVGTFNIIVQEPQIIQPVDESETSPEASPAP